MPKRGVYQNKEGLFTWGEGDSSARKILESGRTFHWVNLQLWLPSRKENAPKNFKSNLVLIVILVLKSIIRMKQVYVTFFILK